MLCEHEITINDICVKCGEHAIITEGPPCSECISFIPLHDDWISCKKGLMTSTRDAFKSHKIKELTCFESNSHNKHTL